MFAGHTKLHLTKGELQSVHLHHNCLAVVAALVGAVALMEDVRALQGALELTNDQFATGYVRVDDDPGLEPQEFTLEAWVRPRGIGLGGTTIDPANNFAGATILSKPQEGACGDYIMSWYLGWSPLTGRFAGYVTHVSPSIGTSVVGTTSVAVDEVAHVALTFDGVELSIYVNGALEGVTTANASQLEYGANDVLIGASNFCQGYLRRFDGTIDEVRVWDRAKNGVEVASQLYCQFGFNPTGLLAHWTFDGQSLTDVSGNGHDGVAQDAGTGFVGGLPQLVNACGQIGTTYCSPSIPNSTGASGAMYVYGSAAVTENALILVVSDLPPGTFGFFLTSMGVGQVSNPGGSQGVLCLGGGIGRFNRADQVRNTGFGGTFSVRADVSDMPTPFGPAPILAGQTWNYQAWHRDTVSGQPTSNFTDAVQVMYF